MINSFAKYRRRAGLQFNTLAQISRSTSRSRSPSPILALRLRCRASFQKTFSQKFPPFDVSSSSDLYRAYALIRRRATIKKKKKTAIENQTRQKRRVVDAKVAGDRGLNKLTDDTLKLSEHVE